MFYRYRRFWGPVTALVLAVPLAFMVVTSRQPNVSADELRALAPTPSFPRTWDNVLSLPPQADAWLKDHFGLRSTLTHVYALINQVVLHTGNDLVLIGRDGWMFLRLIDAVWGSVDTLQQGAGQVRRDQQVTETANMLVAMRDDLATQGTRLVVAPPPNTATIYSDYLPLWARNNGLQTELDILLKALIARGVKTVDLRTVLTAERTRGKVYHLHDTHWTARGAVASFNAISEATLHADWRFDMDSALGSPVLVTGGDLARLLGISGDVTEPDQYLALHDVPREMLSSGTALPTFTSTLNRPGPTILIIGNSFTFYLFEPLVAQRAGRVMWTDNLGCGFDWKWLEDARPDEVWWMPTERLVLCRPGVRPKGFPS